MSWTWRDEAEPPEPQGVLGTGAASRRLLAALAATTPEARAGLMATANLDVLILTGPGANLPWADGVTYLAPRPDAPSLWLPTHQRPDIALDLLERALHRRHPQRPVALLRTPARLLPLHRLLPADDTLLAQIRARWQDA